MAGAIAPVNGTTVSRLRWNLRTLLASVVLASFAASPRARAAFLEALRQAFGATVGRVLRLAAGLGRPPVRKDFLSLGSEARRANAVSAGKFALRETWRTPAESSHHAVTSKAASDAARFADFGDVLPDWLSEALHSNGFDTMKPIQREILPLALAGNNVVGVAPTGSGKTLAFLVPGLVHAAGQPPLRGPADGPIVLVLAPTRELAVQIGSVAESLTRQQSRGAGGSRWGQSGPQFNCAVLYGGARRSDQLQTLRFQNCTQVVVATPGRLLDFLEHRAFGLSRVSFFVLDEGDRMLDFGFEPDVTTIAKNIRSDRQMLFFSATWPPEVEEAARRLCGRGYDFQTIFATREDKAKGAANGDADEQQKALPGQEGIALPPRDIKQVVEVLEGISWDYNYAGTMSRKIPLLLEHLEGALAGGESHAPGKALIFVGTRRAAEELGEVVADRFGLRRCGIMHGARKQDQREATLRAFRTGQIRALVATDVVGRGVDIPQVTHVVIFDFPGDIETYVHRVGRTGRNGQPGVAVSFFEPQPWSPHLSRELAEVLIGCGQHVPDALKREAGLLSWDNLQNNSSMRYEDEEPLWAIDEAQAWRTAPPLNSDGGPELASEEELGAWNACGARVWGYSANGGFSEQGRLELRTNGILRTTWGWGEWSLVQAEPQCPPPLRMCPAVPEPGGEPPCPPPSRPCPPLSSAPDANETPAGSQVHQPPAPHLAISWGGCTDIVALDATGMGFALVSRSGRPAHTYKKKTLGRALVGVNL